MSRGLDGSQMRSVSDISGLCERLLPKTLAVSVQRRMGWHVLQPGLELLHQPRALQERRHVLQHGPGPVHVRVRPWIYGARVQHRPGTDQQTGNGLFHRADMPQRWHMQGKRRIVIFLNIIRLTQNSVIVSYISQVENTIFTVLAFSYPILISGGNLHIIYAPVIKMLFYF